jgi:ribosomal protein L16 Arg81 hydroxylase
MIEPRLDAAQQLLEADRLHQEIVRNLLEAFARHKQIRLPAHQHDLPPTSEVVRQVAEEAEFLFARVSVLRRSARLFQLQRSGYDLMTMLRFFLSRAALRRDPQKQLAGRHRGEAKRVGRLSFVAAILDENGWLMLSGQDIYFFRVETRGTQALQGVRYEMLSSGSD